MIHTYSNVSKPLKEEHLLMIQIVIVVAMKGVMKNRTLNM